MSTPNTVAAWTPRACAFCGKTRREVAHLVVSEAGRVTICNECVELCVTLLAKKDTPA